MGDVLFPQATEPCPGTPDGAQLRGVALIPAWARPWHTPALGWCLGTLGPCPGAPEFPSCSPQGHCPSPALWAPVSPVCSQPCPSQVSEQFARYLDVQIQELRRAAGSTGPLERLQQFLEPFVVFSGLELAHTFEHFYR